MATNDVNLQVINSMTQEKMNSLKNADGKIPSLANQLIMTDDEDVNLSQLRTKVLWTNPNPTSSFASQTITLSSDDYDYLAFITTHNTSNGIKAPLCVMPKGYGARLCSVDASSNSAYRPMVIARDVTSVSNTQLSVSVCRYNYGTTYTEERNDLLVPYQVIGLYKQPAMIYTGKELFAGNGIAIEDGVISSKGLEYVGYYSADGNVSVDIDLDKYDYFAFVRINTNSSTDVNLGIFPNTSFNVYTNDKSASSTFSYCYLFYAKSFSTSLYITYNQNNDGYVRVYPSDRGVTFASSTSKPTKLTTYSSGTVTIANIILYRRKK